MPENTAFAGFEYPVGQEALTIPASFMQQVIAHENLSTIRVVGYILTKSLEGQHTIEASYEDFRKFLNLSRCAVHEGLKQALAAGYILLLQAGENGHTRARYALNWQHKTPNSSNGNSQHEENNSDRAIVLPTTQIATHPENQTGYQSEQTRNIRAVPVSNQPEKHTGVCWSENLTTITDSKRLESNRIEEVESFPLPVQKTAKRQTAFQTNSIEPAAGELSILSLSSYLTNLSRDFSRELGDESHTGSNRSQTMNLWHKSKLTEKDFAGLMYRARELTRRYAVLRPGEKEPAPGQLRNRMAYFFTVLRNLLEEAEPQVQNRCASGYALVDLPQPVAATTTPTQQPAEPCAVTNTRQAERTRLHESWKRYLNRPIPSLEGEPVVEGIRRYV